MQGLAGNTAALQIAAGSQTALSGSVVLAASNGISFGLSGSALTGSAHGSAVGGAVVVAVGTNTQTSGTVVLSNVGGASFGMSGSTRITASILPPTLQFWNNVDLGGSQYSSIADQQLKIYTLGGNAPFFPGVMTVSTMFLDVTGASGAINGAFTNTLSVGFYTIVNSTQLSLAFSASTTWGTNASSAGGLSPTFDGPRWLTLQSSQFNNVPAFSQTQYFVALWKRTSSNNYPFSIYFGNTVGMSQSRSGFLSTASVNNTSQGNQIFAGNYSASFATAMPNSLAASDISHIGVDQQVVPRLIFNNLGSNIL